MNTENMNTGKMLTIVDIYRRRLEEENIPKNRMSVEDCFSDLTKEEGLAHAHYLVDEFEKIKDYGRKNRHLTAIQLCLSYVGWYTLKELMNHNNIL